MGVSCSAKIVIGLEVRHEDFWTTVTTTDDHVSCPQGHPSPGNVKFCQECGGKLQRQTHSKLVCNPNFAKIAGDDNPEGRAGETWNPEHHRHADEQCNPEVFGVHGLELVCVDAYEDGMGDRDLDSFVLGFVIHSVVNISSGGNEKIMASEEKSLAHWFDECRTLGTKLGIDREPLLYLNTSAG